MVCGSQAPRWGACFVFNNMKFIIKEEKTPEVRVVDQETTPVNFDWSLLNEYSWLIILLVCIVWYFVFNKIPTGPIIIYFIYWYYQQTK